MESQSASTRHIAELSSTSSEPTATWRVRSLNAVDPARIDPVTTSSVRAVADSEAGQLFVDRARLAVPEFALAAHNALTVAEICLPP
jgi:predicted ATPase